MPAGALRAHLEHFLSPVLHETLELHGSWGSLAVGRAAFDLLPVVDDAGRISVLIGDPVVRDDTLAAPLDSERRRALHHSLGSTPLGALAERLDGHYALLSVDQGTGEGALVTDRFGFVGVYHAEPREGPALIIGTHPDAVARAAGRASDVDLVSAADMLLNLSCTWPYTLYERVSQAQAGAVRAFGGGGWLEEPRPHWTPTESPAFESFDQAVVALRDGFAAAARAVTTGAEQVGLLLSGGEDSRAVLGAIPPGVRVRAFIYADWESREVRIARAVAGAYGAELTVGGRAPDHYLAGFESVASIVGSAHLFMDVHGFGFERTLGLSALPVVLGGLSADSLVKAEHAPPARARHAPVPVPDESGVRAALRDEVIARRTSFRDLLARIRPRTADEWISLWPFSMRKHGGNVDGNRRLFRSHELYHCSAVLDVAARAPRAWKERRKLFRTAMRPFLERTRFLPHTEYRFPYFGPAANAALFPVLALARGMRAVAAGELRARHRPWPKWSAIADSAAARAAEERHSATKSPLAEVLDVPSAQLAGTVAGWYSLRRLMLLQLSYVTMKARN